MCSGVPGGGKAQRCVCFHPEPTRKYQEPSGAHHEIRGTIQSLPENNNKLQNTWRWRNFPLPRQCPSKLSPGKLIPPTVCVYVTRVLCSIAGGTKGQPFPRLTTTGEHCVRGRGSNGTACRPPLQLPTVTLPHVAPAVHCCLKRAAPIGLSPRTPPPLYKLRQCTQLLRSLRLL